MKKPEWKQIDFRAEVIEYIKSLTDFEREKFKTTYNNLIDKGRDVKWIYFALEQLGTRSIISAERLFNYDGFCQDVDLLVESYNYERDKRAHSALVRDKVDYEYQGVLCARLAKTYTKEKGLSFFEKYYQGEDIPRKVIEECLRNLPSDSDSQSK